ncbi:hypothetical protein EDB92DRAFT_313878 [Lactarius akahatsu]|uniref:DUF6535 domain-containing protein n=1 Tax=Lactarius akahatsu TaxID=416441 RepID=A0AAD4LIR2_9AGAM|nr:hypothetical protein EDB92DRAFT_313878 [Lactarius akahatsu]
MPRRTRRRGDPEQLEGEQLPLDDLEEEARSETLETRLEPVDSGGRRTNNSLHGEHKDFDDGANALWSLYCKVAQTHDETQFQGLAKDMDGVLLFAGLFSAVLTSFLITSLQDLQPDPAQQSIYYHQQSVAMLAQISQQIASIAPQVSVPSTPPPPYPLHLRATDVRVNAYWLIGLVCSLSAALFATLVQRWVRAYMQIFQRYDHPLKRARFRQFFFEGARSMRAMAVAVPTLIRFSLVLFAFGLSDSMLNANTTIGVITVVLVCCCGLFFLYSVLAPLLNLQSPHQSLFSRPIFFLMQKFKQPYFGDPSKPASVSMEAYQERLVMGETDERKGRDVRAIRWLIDHSAVNAEMEPLLLAIPDSFNTERAQEVWREVSSQPRDTLDPLISPSPSGSQVPLMSHPPHPFDGAAVDTISRRVRYLFETCNHHSYFENEEARRRRMRVCVEATASLVCCVGYRLDRFGGVGKLVSEIGHIEMINQTPVTTSDPSFIVRWTCLSLVAVQQILASNRLQVLAGYAMSGLARSQSEYGQPDETAWRGAHKIDEYLGTAWARVGELRRAFEPWTQRRTREQVEEILRNHERQISELERINVVAVGLEDVDWRISLYQDALDDATYRLTRQLPGVSFDELHRSESVLISNMLTPGSAPVTPQLIFPGQQLQALARLGRKLREVLDGQVADGHKEVLESLKAVDQVPISLRRPGGLMKRQLWRLQDLRDGGGLGFTVELFFLSLRQVLSIPSSHESNSIFYIGSFKTITSHWEVSKESLGTQHILLNIICDLIIRGRGAFSDFSYPESITAILLDTVGRMLQGYQGLDEHIRDAVREIESVDSRTCMDMGLRRKALAAIPRS